MTNINRTLSSRRRSSPTSDIGHLLLLQIGNLALPLAVLPFLARVLGPAAWGRLAVATSIATLAAGVIDFGFSLGGTREVAAAAAVGDWERIALLRSAVARAKTLLLFVALPAALVAGIVAGLQRSGPGLVAATLLLAGVQGLSLAWLFQGLGRLQSALWRDLAARTVSAGLAYALVRGPTEAFVFPALQGGCLCISLISARMALDSRLPRRSRAGWRSAWQVLVENRAFFVFKGMTLMFTSVNVYLVGVLSGPLQAGYYANGERIINAVRSLLAPVSQALFPRAVEHYQSDPDGARKSMLRMAYGLAIFATLALMLLVIFAYRVVVLIFGPQYVASVRPLQLLAISLPLLAISNVVGLQWILPRRQDGVFLSSVGAGALVNLVSAFVLVPRLHSVGMAISVLFSETAVVLMMLVLSRPYASVSSDALVEDIESEGRPV